jgi:hypothetical protein
MKNYALEYLLSKEISEDRARRIEFPELKNSDFMTLETLGLVPKSYGELDAFKIKDVFKDIESILSTPQELKDKIISIADKAGYGKELKETEYSEWPVVVSMQLGSIRREIDDHFIIVDRLGIYISVLNIIIIDTDLIACHALENKKEYSVIYEDVLRHELGHWFSHELLINVVFWDDEKFRSSSKEIKEFWAQILGYYFNSIQCKEWQKEDAKSLNNTSPYKLFLDYVDKPVDKVIRLLGYRENDTWEDLRIRLDKL